MSKFVPQGKKAERIQLKASILVDSISGNGKTGFALQGLWYLAGEDWSKVGICDTESNSAPLYVGRKMPDGSVYGQFLHYSLDKYSGFPPSNYLACREDAVKQGVTAFAMDSITHAWNSTGGILDMVSAANAAANTYQKNYTGWGDQNVINEKSNLIEMIRSTNCHMITTGRVKREYIMEEYTDKNGMTKTKPVPKGMGIIQDSTIEFEPDLVVSLLAPGSLTNYPIGEIIKSRYDIFTKGETYEFTPAIWRSLKAWLEEGADGDAILEEQRQELIKICKDMLDKDAMKRMIWKAKKTSINQEQTKIEDLSLEVLKILYASIL